MADSALSSLTALTSIAPGDLFYVVDVSDTTDAATGTSKRITRANVISGLAASGANSDITSLTALTTPLSVAQGGSGAATLTGILKGSGTSAFTAVTAPSGAIVGDTDSQTLTNKTLTSPVLNTGISGTAFLDEDNMASDSATKLASQQSIKAYVDGKGASKADTDIAGASATTSSTFADITGSDVGVTLTVTSNILLTASIQVYGNTALTGSVDYEIQFHDGSGLIGPVMGVSIHPSNARQVATLNWIVPSAAAGAKAYTVRHRSVNNTLSCTAEAIAVSALAVPA